MPYAIVPTPRRRPLCRARPACAQGVQTSTDKRPLPGRPAPLQLRGSLRVQTCLRFNDELAGHILVPEAAVFVALHAVHPQLVKPEFHTIGIARFEQEAEVLVAQQEPVTYVRCGHPHRIGHAGLQPQFRQIRPRLRQQVNRFTRGNPYRTGSDLVTLTRLVQGRIEGSALPVPGSNAVVCAAPSVCARVMSLLLQQL